MIDRSLIAVTIGVVSFYGYLWFNFLTSSPDFSAWLGIIVVHATVGLTVLVIFGTDIFTVKSDKKEIQVD